ncbi:unnamed protein product [Prunus armeniaca]
MQTKRREEEDSPSSVEEEDPPSSIEEEDPPSMRQRYVIIGSDSFNICAMVLRFWSSVCAHVFMFHPSLEQFG